MKLRSLLGAGVLATAAMTLTLATAATAGVGVSTCNQARWCTITASGYVTQTASQLAIGNVSAGTGLAVVLSEHQQYGGEILGGNLRGLCAWSQYARDWTAAPRSKDANCAHLVLNAAAFVAANGRAIWTACNPHCFGGVPLHFDPLCGTRGHDWCYRRNCREFANFYPWMKSAHPTQPLRMTSGQWLNIRYRARYKDARTHRSFYLVEDTAAVHGTGNWVFISGPACAITAGAPGTYTATRAPTPARTAPTAPEGQEYEHTFVSPTSGDDRRFSLAPLTPIAARGNIMAYARGRTHRPIEAWMTNAAGPFVTIRPGGPLSSVVTIAALSNARLVVEASWKVNGESRSTSQTVDSYDDARRLAHEWGDLLIIGREPEEAL